MLASAGVLTDRRVTAVERYETLGMHTLQCKSRSVEFWMHSGSCLAREKRKSLASRVLSNFPSLKRQMYKKRRGANYFSADDSNWSSYYSQVKIADNDGSRWCISSHNFEFSRKIEKIARPFGRRYPGLYLVHDCLVSRNNCAELNRKRGSKKSSKNL